MNTFQIIIPLSNCKTDRLNKLLIKLMLTTDFNINTRHKNLFQFNSSIS